MHTRERFGHSRCALARRGGGGDYGGGRRERGAVGDRVVNWRALRAKADKDQASAVVRGAVGRSGRRVVGEGRASGMVGVTAAAVRGRAGEGTAVWRRDGKLEANEHFGQREHAPHPLGI